MSCLKTAYIYGAEFGRSNGYAHSIENEAECYVAGTNGWEKIEGPPAELDEVKEAFIRGAEFGRANGYAYCFEEAFEQYIKGW